MKTKVLMVCLGNICRSPLAEGLLRAKVDPEKVIIDSAGTSDYHIDEQPDERMIAMAKDHGLDLTNLRGRQFTAADFKNYDHIYVMDQTNYDNVLKLADSPGDTRKVDLILNQIYPGDDMDVPDPYFGGTEGFKNVYKLLDKSTDIIAKNLNREKPKD